MDLKPKDLKYYVLPGEYSVEGSEKIYREAYRMWREVWSQTFLELDGSGRIFSDDFTRQSIVGAVFHGDECAAMTCFHRVDFALPTAVEDSYFKIWPEEALQQLVRDGEKVLVCSHLTVSPKYRGAVDPSGMTLKLLVSDLSVRVLLESDCAVMTGTMRNNRGAQNAAYAAGASPILRNAIMHGVEVDLVGFYRTTILREHDLTNVWTETLWRHRSDLRHRAAEKTIPKAS